jgi:hypothetical protein
MVMLLRDFRPYRIIFEYTCLQLQIFQSFLMGSSLVVIFWGDSISWWHAGDAQYYYVLIHTGTMTKLDIMRVCARKENWTIKDW